jgi:hypothetical protein
MMSFHKVAPNVWIFARTISTYYGFSMMVVTGELFFLSLWMELANNVKCQVTTMFKELKKKSYLLRRILNRRKKTQFASMTEILPPLRSPLLCRLFSTHQGCFFLNPPHTHTPQLKPAQFLLRRLHDFQTVTVISMILHITMIVVVCCCNDQWS